MDKTRDENNEANAFPPILQHMIAEATAMHTTIRTTEEVLVHIEKARTYMCWAIVEMAMHFGSQTVAELPDEIGGIKWR